MTDTRAGFVALIGEPNAGKSTLLNKMVGAKVSIVTHKVQTTRARIRGIAMAGQAQIVFVDTPGLFRPRRRLDRAMVKAAWGGAADADIIVLLIEAHRGMTDGVVAIIDRMKDQVPQGQQDRPGEGRGSAGAGAKDERGVPLCGNLHDFGGKGVRRR
jgi:GTPase